MATTTSASGSDVIDGTASGEKLVGGAGSDTIDGGAGSDFINAGGGNDWIFYDEADYKILGGGGIDTLWFTGSHQNLNFGTQAVNGIEALWLLGGGGHTVTFSAADVVRVSDSDRFVITGAASNTIKFGDSGWTWGGLINGGAQNLFTKDGATIITDWAVNVSGFSYNATVEFVPGSVQEIVEDSPTASRGATGYLRVTDINPGQAKLLPSMLEGLLTAVDAQGNPSSGRLQIGASANEGYYFYGYFIDNSNAQSLGAGDARDEFFTVTTIDGTQETLKFTVIGVNDTPMIVAGGTTSKSVLELAYDADGANSTTPISITGSFQVSDADSGDHLTAVDGQYQIAGKYDGGLSFNISDKDAATGLRTVTWTYTYTDAALNSLGEGATDADVFTLQLTDGTATISPTVTINFTGAPDTPPIVAAITESTKGYIGYYDPIPDATTGLQSFVVGDGARDVRVSESSTNIPYLGNLTAELRGSQVEWSYKVREYYIDYLKANESLIQRYTVSWMDEDERTHVQEIDVEIKGVGDNELEFYSGDIIDYASTKIIRAGYGSYYVNSVNDSKIYLSEGSDYVSIEGMYNSLIRFGGGDDSARLEDISSSSRLFGDAGNDQFRLDVISCGGALIWGGPGSDQFTIRVSGSDFSEAQAATVLDFNIAAPENGGDKIFLSISRNTPLKLVDFDPNNQAAHRFELTATIYGSDVTLLNLIGTDFDLDTMIDQQNIVWS